MHQLNLVNADLDLELARYQAAPLVIAGVRSALGARADEILTAENYPVRAFLFLPSDQLLRCFFVTPGRFIVFEMLTDGTSLCVSVPFRRVSRVVETRAATAVLVTIELDADNVRTTTRGGWVAMPVFDEEGQPTNTTRDELILSADSRPSVYEISAIPGSEADAELSEFARRVRYALDL